MCLPCCFLFLSCHSSAWGVCKSTLPSVNCQCQYHRLCIYSNWVDFAIYNLAGWLAPLQLADSAPFLFPSGEPYRHPALLAVYYYTAHLPSPSMAYRINSSGRLMFVSHSNAGSVHDISTYGHRHRDESLNLRSDSTPAALNNYFLSKIIL